jgi:hypothetical protein
VPVADLHQAEIVRGVDRDDDEVVVVRGQLVRRRHDRQRDRGASAVTVTVVVAGTLTVPRRVRGQRRNPDLIPRLP